MIPTPRWFRLCLPLLALAAGCGQKGPLYLEGYAPPLTAAPKPSKPAKPKPAAVPAQPSANPQPSSEAARPAPADSTADQPQESR